MYGPCRACIAGKSTNKTSHTHLLDEPPADIGERLHADIIYLKTSTKRIPLLVCVEHQTNYGHIVPLPNKNQESVLSALNSVIADYIALGYFIREISTDPEAVLISLKTFINVKGIQLTHSPTGEHEVKVERYVRILRERFRCVLSTLNFHLPSKLYPYLLMHIVSMLNMTPNVNTPDSTPRTILTNKKIHYSKELTRNLFGPFCEAQVPQPDSKEDKRTFKALLIGSRPNQLACARLFNIETGTISYSANYHVINPTPSDINLLDTHESKQTTYS